MKTDPYVSLKTIPLNLQQEILHHFGHPYKPINRDIIADTFTLNKTHQKLQKMKAKNNNRAAEEMTIKINAVRDFLKSRGISNPTNTQLMQMGLNTRERWQYRLILR